MALLAYTTQRDIAPERLCELADIDPKWIVSKDRSLLTAKQLDDLWANAVYLTKDPDLGLHFGESIQLAALGIVGELIKSSSTIGAAVTVAAELGHMVTNLFKMQVKQARDTFTVSIEPLTNGQSLESAKQTLDVLMVMVIHELDGLLMKKISPLKISFVSKTGSSAEHERVLRCKPQYTGKVNEVTFDRRYWDEPIITANYELQNFLREKISTYTENNKPEDKLADRIRHYLMSNAYLGIGSLNEIAANFNVSARTLQRRLRDEEVSFQQLADGVRQQLAVQAITQGNYSVKEIAYSLGYNELSAFSRAFKRWTSVSPDHYKTQSLSPAISSI
jgi:AraC-like DNA-binding protein